MSRCTAALGPPAGLLLVAGAAGAVLVVGALPLGLAAPAALAAAAAAAALCGVLAGVGFNTAVTPPGAAFERVAGPGADP